MDNNNEWEMNPAIFELFLLYYYMREIVNYFAKASLVYYLGIKPRVLQPYLCSPWVEPTTLTTELSNGFHPYLDIIRPFGMLFMCGYYKPHHTINHIGWQHPKAYMCF